MLEMKLLQIFALIALIFPQLVVANLELESAIAIAIRNNPNLAKIQARYKALAEIPQQVGTLPDPSISLNAMNFPTDSFTRKPSIAFSWKVNIKTKG